VAGDTVLVTRRLPADVMDRLAAQCEVSCWSGGTAMPRDALLRDASGKRAIITLLTERVDAELLEAAGGQLRIVANYAVGVDNIDIAACTARSVMVTNTPDVLTEATADMAWALMMSAARRVAEGDRLLRSGEQWSWGPDTMLGQDVYGRTLGIIGFGRIGRAVARRAVGFGMRVAYVAHSASTPAPVERTGSTERVDGIEAMAIEDLLAISDFVSLHVNLTDETRHLISMPQLAAMKPTAVLVNTSRGPVVDEEALADALESGTIFAAGLDVFEREPEVSPRLLSQPRVVLCPHLGSATVATRRAMGMLAVDNVLAALRGERPPSLVNDPLGEQPRGSAG
jgi:glyoxylate reductase